MNKSAAALRMPVELRNHPRMSYRKVPSWPPSWVWISGSERPFWYTILGRDLKAFLCPNFKAAKNKPH